MYNGLGLGLGNLPRLSNAKSRSISAENFTGAKGAGAMATEGMGAGCARDLGRGWKISPSIVVHKHSTFTLADIEGPGAIQSIWMTGNVGSYDTILRIYWEGQDYPSVEAPVAAFFGNAFANNINGTTGSFPHLNSLPVLVAPNRGLNCFWEMPFRKHCKITLENISDDDKVCYFQINYTLTEVPDDVAYFHAQYRQAKPVDYKTEYVILDGVRGKGHYVGTTLNVNLNSAGGWWGEGEIKFFIDGDKADAPTICGTGTEDYFGGAWCFGDTYSTPFLGYPLWRKEPGEVPKHGLYRWHVPDPIRFETDLKVTMQALGWWPNWKYQPLQDDIASVGYWYQLDPHAPFPEMLPVHLRWPR